MITPKLPHGYTWEVPCPTPDDHQRDTKQTNTMGPTLPPSDSPGPVNETQAKKI